jgi:hypothetical protein
MECTSIGGLPASGIDDIAEFPKTIGHAGSPSPRVGEASDGAQFCRSRSAKAHAEAGSEPLLMIH